MSINCGYKEGDTAQIFLAKLATCLLETFLLLTALILFKTIKYAYERCHEHYRNRRHPEAGPGDPDVVSRLFSI